MTEKSMGVMFQCQTDKHIKLAQTCSPLMKLRKAQMGGSAEQAALVVSLVDEVKAMVPIPDDTLQGMFVRLYIENDPQVHLEICSVLVTRADGFVPQDLGVLKALMDSHRGPQAIPIIHAMSVFESHMAEVDEQEFQLLMHQLTYVMDMWRVTNTRAAITAQRCSSRSTSGT